MSTDWHSFYDIETGLRVRMPQRFTVTPGTHQPSGEPYDPLPPRDVNDPRYMASFDSESGKIYDKNWRRVFGLGRPKAPCGCCVCLGRMCFLPHPGHSHSLGDPGPWPS